MLRIELDDLSRVAVLGLLEEHLRNMYGAGRALLNHIIEVSRSRGYHALYLETGCHPAFLPAQSLYRSAGFAVCGPFGAYRENGNSVFMSLRLA
jgi:putative acetyltransferase